jgi:hypothetical protein
MIKQEKPSIIVPKYLETWGEIVAFARFAQRAALLSLFFTFLLLFWALRTLNRPPIVIQVDERGNPTITECKNTQNVTPQEIQNFVSYFVEYYTGWDYYKYDEYATRASKMMTKKMLAQARALHDRGGIASIVKAQKVHRKINISEVNIRSVGKSYIAVEVRGIRSEGYYEKTDNKDVVFSISLNLVAVPRTQSLWGLLADTCEEHNYNE